MNMAYAMAGGHPDAGPATGPALPGSLQIHRRLSRWLRFAGQGMVEVFSGKVELGQGILTALAQIVADELDVDLAQVRMVPACTACSPNEAVTSGSLSIQESGAALRQACAEVRALLLHEAARQWHAEPSALRAEAGEIIHPDGRRIGYQALAKDGLLDRDATGMVAPKKRSDYRFVGHAAARLDLPAKVFGLRRFIHDLVLPGMRHARMLRPPAPAATLRALDVTAFPPSLGGNAEWVRDGSLLAVLADSPREADKAADWLMQRTQWTVPEALSLPDETGLAQWLAAQPRETTDVSIKTADDPVQQPARTVRATYAKPFIAHASLAPSCALARFDGRQLEVWTHSQGIYNLRRDLAKAFAMAEDDIVIAHVEGAGCYGHNGADDVAYDAAWLARQRPGVPVRVQWSRSDELSWAPFGPAMTVALEADLDTAGNILAWRHTVTSNGHSNRPGRAATPALLGSWHGAQPFPVLTAINAPLAAGGGAERNAVPSYDFPSWHVVSHRVLSMPLRTSALRALGALANVFAAESFMDELAAQAGRDPVAFRLACCADARGRAVIETAAARGGWGTPKDDGVGRGIGYARYKNTGAWCAVVAEVAAEREIVVKKLSIAVDVGLVINPDGVRNQIEGGAIQATSWTLKEAVRFDRARVTSDSWEAYPVLRFSEVSQVDVALIDSDAAPLGAGEASIGPTAAAIANAVADVLGLRVRELPITAERIMQLIS